MSSSNVASRDELLKQVLRKHDLGYSSSSFWSWVPFGAPFTGFPSVLLLLVLFGAPFAGFPSVLLLLGSLRCSFENENLIKQPPDATSSSDSDPDFSPSPRHQTFGLRPSGRSIPRTLISPPTYM
ncbi:hypothetical protein AVEN_126078-1 [Araneus ventricosus]|uniref:Uncharacterized protein n=1 Tax=Araneus ventricosus TaxID=182803 RepID=A0A4Y2CLX8_ARAVE|nr:hypothetical protein AVEN_126078-1 [Araneus ventricosus]